MFFLRRIAPALVLLLAACQDITQPDVLSESVKHSVTSSSVTASPLAYVANVNSDDISVIATNTQTVVATVPLGRFPRSVAITPDDRFVYVANSLSNTVSVIDASSLAVHTTVSVGTNPFDVAMSPDGDYAYVANILSASVSVIETASNAVVATVGVALNPSSVAVTPDGALVYTTGALGISVIDATTNTFVTTFSSGGVRPSDIAFTPDGAFAYVSHLNSNTVTVFDVPANTLVAVIPVGLVPRSIVITPDGARVYVGNGVSKTVSVIETATNSVVTTIPVSSFVNGLAILPDGTQVYATIDFPTHGVDVIETATNSVVTTIGVGQTPWGIAITRGGAQALTVEIDIKPGSDPNSISCTNDGGVIPVAILTTPAFDATTVDHTTVTFEGATETHLDKRTGEPRRHEEDMDGDGDTDLVFHFRYGDTGLDCLSIEGTLSGEMFDGTQVEGTDAVRMVGG